MAKNNGAVIVDAIKVPDDLDELVKKQIKVLESLATKVSKVEEDSKELRDYAYAIGRTDLHHKLVVGRIAVKTAASSSQIDTEISKYVFSDQEV